MAKPRRGDSWASIPIELAFRDRGRPGVDLQLTRKGRKWFRLLAIVAAGAAASYMLGPRKSSMEQRLDERD